MLYKYTGKGLDGVNKKMIGLVLKAKKTVGYIWEFEVAKGNDEYGVGEILTAKKTNVEPVGNILNA